MTKATSQLTGAGFLDLAGICKSFGRFQALKDVSLAAARGELMVFLGPSGCGKTTLLRIIAGLEFQDEGRIVQDGRDISRLGVVGPTRMDYSNSMAAVRAVARYLSRTLGEN